MQERPLSCQKMPVSWESQAKAALASQVMAVTAVSAARR